MLFPTDANRDKLVRWFIGDNPLSHEAFYEQLWLGLQGRPKVPIPILIPRYKLQKIVMPVMFILGEHDPTISASRGLRRIKKFLPHAHAHVIQDVGHVLNVEAACQVEELVINFLNDN